jgi:two-component system, cell cycle response regulator DivK
MAPRTVLLVEDNEDNRVIYAMMLTHSGYHVLEADNGGDGVRMAREHAPDVILMDISIPVIDGWAATRMLKGDPATAQIPVIALTAHALEEHRRHAASAGCDGYLCKPCEPGMVLQEVQRFIGASD